MADHAQEYVADDDVLASARTARQSRSTASRVACLPLLQLVLVATIAGSTSATSVAVTPTDADGAAAALSDQLSFSSATRPHPCRRVGFYVLSTGVDLPGRVPPTAHTRQRFDDFQHTWNQTCGMPLAAIPCRSEIHLVRGCGLQHAYVECIRESLASGDEAAIFIEDDAIPLGEARLCHDSFRQELFEAIERRNDSLILLGGHRHERHPSGDEFCAANVGYTQLSSSYGSYAFMAGARTLERIAALWTEELRATCEVPWPKLAGHSVCPDVTWYKAARVYGTTPILMGHMAGLSFTWRTASTIQSERSIMALRMFNDSRGPCAPTVDTLSTTSAAVSSSAARSAAASMVKPWPRRIEGPRSHATTPLEPNILSSPDKATFPHIFHQIWLSTSPMPPEKVAFSRSVRELARAAGWSYRLWTMADVSPAVLPRLNDMVSSACTRGAFAQAKDMMSFEIAYTHGGVHVDLNIELVSRNLTDFIELKAAQGFQFLGCNEEDERARHLPFLTNAWFAVAPQHPIFAHMIGAEGRDKMQKAIEAEMPANQATGPYHFRWGLDQLTPQQRQRTLILPSVRFFPFIAWGSKAAPDPCFAPTGGGPLLPGQQRLANTVHAQQNWRVSKLGRADDAVLAVPCDPRKVPRSFGVDHFWSGASWRRAGTGP